MQEAAMMIFVGFWAILFLCFVGYGTWLFVAWLYDAVFEKGYRNGWRDGWDDAHEVIANVELDKQRSEK